MSPLLLALALSASITTHHSPAAHYVATTGYIDTRISTIPQPIVVWPAVQHNLSQEFSSSHPAIDIYAKLGQPVVAMSDGVVTEITNTGSYGNKIVIQHPYLPDTTETLYAHLDTMNVEVGQTVIAGQQIATIGVTGNSTGPHLHFEIHHSGVAIDPMTVIQ